MKMDEAAPWAKIVAAVMAEEGLPLEGMKIQGMRQPFFSKGERAAKIDVSELAAEDGEDELNAGKQKLIVYFELPRGCYATMVVKRLTQ